MRRFSSIRGYKTMGYKDQLNTMSNDNAIQEDRGLQISQDIRDVLNDNTVFGELVAASVGEAAARAIDKWGIDSITEKGIEGIKAVANYAVTEALRSEEFSSRLGDELGWKDTQREQVNTSMEREG